MPSKRGRLSSDSLHRAHGLCNTRGMTIKRLDHVSVVVDDLAAAIAFFTALGMTHEGEMPIEGPWVDRVNGVEGALGGASRLFEINAATETWPLTGGKY